jgi:hypothetical protein
MPGNNKRTHRLSSALAAAGPVLGHATERAGP